MTVGSLMTRRVIALKPTASVAEAARLMREKAIGSVLVLDGAKRPVGIITDRDIAVSVVAGGRDPKATRLDEVMTRKVVTADQDEILLRAVRRMAEASIRRLPVVDGRGRVVGMVSVEDILVVLITELSNVVAAIVGPSKLI